MTPRLVQRILECFLEGRLLKDGSFQYVLLRNSVRMRRIIRTQTELFTQTAFRQAAAFDVVVNGNYVDATLYGYTHVATGLAQTGKTIIAYYSRLSALLVGVQPNGISLRQTYARLGQALVRAGFCDAIFVTGVVVHLSGSRGDVL